MTPQDRSLVPTYALLVLIWASTPLAITWSAAEISRLWSLWFRFAFSVPLVLLLLLALRTRLPLDKTSLHSYLAGSFSLIVSQTFTYLATAHLPSGMIALMFGFAPVLAGLIGFFVFGQRLHPLQWAGMMIALGGLYLISSSNTAQHINPLGFLYMLASVLIYSSSIFWVKHINARITPVAQASGSILASMLIGTLFLPFIWQEFPSQMPSPRTLMAIAYTVVVASIIGMFCYFKLVQSVSAITLSLATVLTPMLAILLGVALNGETIRLQVLVGSMTIIAGLLLYFSRDLLQALQRRQ
ncbi:MAG: EamA family transporter [Pigmentiphaga sp.]|nr:EamA family transporter [Pigmentiphaga sp.]